MKFRYSTFYEAIESPNEAYARDNCRLERQFLLWNQSPGGQLLPLTFQTRRQFVEDVVGANLPWQDFTSGARYIKRLTPFAVPAAKTNFLAAASSLGVYISPYYCTAVPRVRVLPSSGPFPKSNNPADQLPGQPGSTGVAQGSVALCDCYFDALPFIITEDANVLAGSAPPGGTPSPIIGFPDEGDRLRAGLLNSRYIVRYLDFTGRLIQLPEGVIYFPVDAPNAPPYPVALSIPESSCLVIYEWQQVPEGARPLKAIQKLLTGTCNETTFDGWPKGTISLKTVKEKRYQTALGTIEYTVSYVFEFLAHQRRSDGMYLGWNSGLRRATSPGSVPDFAVVDFKNDGTSVNPPFPYVDYSALFRPDQS